MKAIAVIGNPKPASRTRDAALRLLVALGFDEPDVVEVAALGPGVLGWGDPAVLEARRRVKEAQVAVFASPTFKGTYTGLLKTFIDQFETGTGLQGVVAIPLMLGAGPAHALAPELLLKPVLTEIGAICPTPAVYQLDSAYAEDPAVAAWVGRWKPVIVALAHLSTTEITV